MTRMRSPRQLRHALSAPKSWEKAETATAQGRVSRGGGGGGAGKAKGAGDKVKSGGGGEKDGGGGKLEAEEEEDNASGSEESKESRLINGRLSHPSGTGTASPPSAPAAPSSSAPEDGEEEGGGSSNGSSSTSTRHKGNKSSEAVEERNEDRSVLDGQETLLEKPDRRDKGGTSKQHAESGLKGTVVNHARNAGATALSFGRDVVDNSARDSQKKFTSNKKSSVSSRTMAPSAGTVRSMANDEEDEDNNNNDNVNGESCKSTTKKTKGESKESDSRTEATVSSEDEAAESRSAEEFNEKVELQKALAGDLARRIVESVLKKAQSEGQVQKHFKLSSDGASDAAIVLNAERRKQMREQEALAQSEHQVLGQVIELLDGLARRTGREQACTRLSPELHSFLLWLLLRGPCDQNAALDDPLANTEGPSVSGQNTGIHAPEAFLFNGQQQQRPKQNKQQTSAPGKAQTSGTLQGVVSSGKQVHAHPPPPASPLPVLSEWNRLPGRGAAHGGPQRVGPQHRLHVDDKNTRWLALEEREKKLHRMLEDLGELPVSALTTDGASTSVSSGGVNWQSMTTPTLAHVTRDNHHFSWLEAVDAAQRLTNGQAAPQTVEVPPLGRLLQETEGAFGRGRRGASNWSGVAEVAAGAPRRRERHLQQRQQEQLQSRRRPPRGGPQWPSEEFTRLQELATKLKAQGGLQ